MRSIRPVRGTLLSCFVLLAALLLPISSAEAGSYWRQLDVSQNEIANGVNGYTWMIYGGPYDAYGSHCDARPGSYVAGSYCRLRWNVPSGLTAGDPAGGGIWYGRYRIANSYFLFRTSRPGGNPDYISDGTDHTNQVSFSHGWGGLGGFVEGGIQTTAATTPTSTTNWFDVSQMAIVLNDPSQPQIAAVSVADLGPTGWRGPGCHATNYAWSDAGSQMWTTTLTNLTTGQAVHSWQNAPGMDVVVSGVPTASLNTCISPPGTGTYVYRTSGYDMSGNVASYDFSIAFDVTAPVVAAPTSGGTAVADGRVFGSASAYRPTISWAISDAHSGVASIVTRIDGATVANTYTGGVVSITPATKLALGNRAVQIVVTDNAGNAQTVNRTIVIQDDAKPTITVAEPSLSGGNAPVLDVSAQDDHSGVDAASWGVRVNGVTLPVSTGNGRLVTSLGRLANGTHDIEIRVSDNAGNQLTQTIQYTATGDAYTAPAKTGVFVITAPSVVYEGDDFHVIALAVKDGRPLTSGRYEVTQQGSQTVLAGKVVTSDGSADLLVEDAVGGPMSLALTGSGLAATTFDYTFHAKTSAPFCQRYPDDPGCRKLTGATGGGDGGGGSGGETGTTGGTGGDGSGTGSTTDDAVSGGPNDKVPPKMTLKAVVTKRGVVARSKQLTLRLASNERANYTLFPVGNKAAVKLAMKKQTRVMRIKLTGALLRRVQKSKARYVVVTMRVVGIDGNKNVVRKNVKLRIQR